MLILLATALLTTLGCADGEGLLPPPRDRWLSDSQRSPHIFSEWTGITSTRPVYGQDGDATYKVVVLENVQGPDPVEAFDKDSPLSQPSPSPRLHYLSNANNLLIKGEEIQAGLNVRVDGFMRVWSESARVYDPEKERGEVAGIKAPPRGKELDRFDLIKVRKVWQILPDGTERLIWETDVPFRGL